MTKLYFGEIRSSSQHPARNRAVIKWQGLIAYNLAGFMAFSGYYQDIAFAEALNAGLNGGGAVADFGEIGARFAAGEDFVANRGGVFMAGVVVGDDHPIGEALGDFAHDRPFPGVAIAAAAENEPELGTFMRRHMRAQRREHVLQRVGLVCVIDEHGGILARHADKLHAPRHAGNFAERLGGFIFIRAGGENEAEGAERIPCLKFSDYRQMDFFRMAKQIEAQASALRGCGGGVDRV